MTLMSLNKHETDEHTRTHTLVYFVVVELFK